MSNDCKNQNKEELYLINAIFESSVMDSFKIYFENKEVLKNWKFIGCTSITENKIRNIICTKEVYNNYWLINFFKYKYLYFIEYKAALKDTIHCFIDYSVSMDTQILSYLKRFVFNSKENIPGNFYEVLNYLITNDVNVDPFEYLYENVNNIDSHLNDITMTLYAYEVFKSLNKDYWISNYLLISNLKHSEIISTVNSEIRELKTVFKNIKEQMNIMFNLIYICLLKMIIIELYYSHKSWYFKLDKFLEYLNDIIGVMAHREIILAKEYFIKGHNLRFFKRINKNMKQPFDIIRNMTWDLYHLHNIERNNLIFTNDDVYFIPCLLMILVLFKLLNYVALK